MNIKKSIYDYDNDQNDHALLANWCGYLAIKYTFYECPTFSFYLTSKLNFQNDNTLMVLYYYLWTLLKA